MTPKRSAHTASLVVLITLVGACGTSTPAATHGAATAHGAQSTGDAGVEHEGEDGDSADANGDAGAPSEVAASEDAHSPCPANMVLVASGEMRFCVDKYEASLVEVDGDGNEKPFPHWLPVDGHAVRAVSKPDVFPQGFISEVQAEDACAASGKRLCSHAEWKTACMGPSKTTFPYGDARQPGVCHDTGKSAVGAVFGARALTDPVAVTPNRSSPMQKQSSGAGAPKNGSKPGRQAHATTRNRVATNAGGRAAETTKTRATRPGSSTTKSSNPSKKKGDKGSSGDASVRGTKRVPAKASQRPASVEPSVWSQLNDPRLGQVDGALAKTGSHDACVNGYGAFDMVGNLHEWVKTDPTTAHGTFAGGYYLDTSLNGDGCQYRTTAHAHDYHDYSTGFRCCAEPKSTAEASRGQD